MTYQGYALLRSNLESGSDADVAKAVAYAKRIKFYPLSQAANPPPTIFVDAIDVVYDATIPYDVRFFQSLDRIVQTEPWLPRDKVMIDMLKSIGIEKGKPFNPDAKTRDILNAAAREAQAWLDARYEAGFPSFYEGRQWAFPASPELAQTMGTFYEGPNAYSVDARGLADYYAYSTTKHLGAGQYYLMAAKDKDGRALDGASRLPAQRAGRRARQAVLVGDGLRPRNPRPHSRSKPVSRSSQTRACKRTPTDRWTSISARKRRRARRRIGCRPAPAENSRFCSASMVPRSRCSTRRGSCRTSKGRTDGDSRQAQNLATQTTTSGQCGTRHRRQFHPRRVGRGLHRPRGAGRLWQVLPQSRS